MGYASGVKPQNPAELLQTARAMADLITGGADAAEQQLILETWTSWYDDALATMTDIEVGGSSESTLALVAAARTSVTEAGRSAVEALGG